MKGRFLVMIFMMIFASIIVLATNGSEIKNPEFGVIKGGLNDVTENILDRQIDFPESIIPMMNLIFGENVTFEKLIILLAIWIAIFIIVKGVVGLIPIFDNDKVELMISLAVTILMVMTGVTEYLISLYLDFLFSLKWMDTLGPFKIFVSAAIIGVIAYGFYKILEIYNRAVDDEKVNKAGEDIGFLRTMGNIMKKNAE